MANKILTYVALLRGINVGGNHKVSMADLKLSFERLGFENVKTYINSGNVIFKSSSLSTEDLELELEHTLEKDFGFPIRVVVRSLTEIEELIRKVPQSWYSGDDMKRNVIFLSRSVDSPSIMDGLAAKPGIEEVHYQPGALLWSASTSNLGSSNMIKLSRNAIYKNITVRIFNTVVKIRDIMQQA